MTRIIALLVFVVVIGLVSQFTQQTQHAVNLAVNFVKEMFQPPQIFQWNTSVAWRQSEVDGGLTESGPFMQREFPFSNAGNGYDIRARLNPDGTVLAAVYFWEQCEPGVDITSDVLDPVGEPFILRCVDLGSKTAYRAGARFPGGPTNWAQLYEGRQVRTNFTTWDFTKIDKYTPAFDQEPGVLESLDE